MNEFIYAFCFGSPRLLWQFPGFQVKFNQAKIKKHIYDIIIQSFLVACPCSVSIISISIVFCKLFWSHILQRRPDSTSEALPSGETSVINEIIFNYFYINIELKIKIIIFIKVNKVLKALKVVENWIIQHESPSNFINMFQIFIETWPRLIKYRIKS